MSTKSHFIREMLRLIRSALRWRGSIERRPDGRFRVVVTGW